MNTLVEKLLIYIPASLILILAGIFFGGEVWAKGKIVLGDILKFMGWAGSSFRKLSVKSEYEGTINSIINDYNKNFETPILPKCKIEWITNGDQKNILKENEAIICLSFDKKDHDLNFYNATLNFVQTGLIAKAKEYLNKSSSKAIDLLTTHIILRDNRRQVLTTFRKKLFEFDDETRFEFTVLVPTNERGLFLHMLLPEFYYYGELIDTLPPSPDFNIEANGLLSWFKELGSRDIDEKINLRYTSKNLKVGVILVGKDETWEAYGPSAYTKWADYYAAEGFNSVYILARGNIGYERATIVTKILTQSKGFDQLNKTPKMKCISADGSEHIITCYSLRPNKTTLIYLAWENFKKHYSEDTVVPAIVEEVAKEYIMVNVFGLQFEILNKFLSEITIADARKVFVVEDEIYLQIIEFDVNNQHIKFSNKGTISDPKHYIEAVLKSKIYSCIVQRVNIDKQGLQTGILVSNPELKSWVYIPKTNATYSRFLDLSKKFERGSHLNITIEKYNSTTSNFIGILENIPDPWRPDNISKLHKGDILTIAVKQINEFGVTCELEEGLECYVPRYEISWKEEECETSKFNIEDRVDVVILLIDSDKRRILTSIKRLTKTPELEFFEANYDKVIEAEVSEIVPSKGIVVKYPGSTNTGFIHWFEIGWGATGRFEKHYKIGDKIGVVIFEFDSERNHPKFSIKRKFKHEFTKWLEIIDSDRPVKGKVLAYFENSVHIELIQKGYTVQAFILRKFISAYTFIENEDLIFFLPIGEIFSFHIQEINEDRQTISLTRLKYLKQFPKPEYGEKITVRYVKQSPYKGYVYSDKIEGWTDIPEQTIRLGSKINIISVSQSTGEFHIV